MMTVKKFYSLVLFVFFITLISIEASNDSFVPCKSFISFSYDDSVTLNNEQFKTQMTFIKNSIAKMNHPERLRVEGGFTGEFNWESGLTIPQMKINIDSAQKTTIPYSLSQQAASLLTSIENLATPPTDPITAIIFISDASAPALLNAGRWFAKLKNVEITFVMLNNVNTLPLRNFTKNFIYWPDLSQPQPDNWNLLSSNTFGCQKPVVDTYFPCKSDIVIALDCSMAIGDMAFNQMKKLVSSNIVTNKWTNFERVGLIAYNKLQGFAYEFGRIENKTVFDSYMNDTYMQIHAKPSIDRGLNYIIGEYNDGPLNIQNTVFFTSTSDPSDILESTYDAKSIDEKGALIIVAVYPAKKQALLPLVSGDETKIVEFNPSNESDFENVASQIMKKFYCSN